MNWFTSISTWLSALNSGLFPEVLDSAFRAFKSQCTVNRTNTILKIPGMKVYKPIVVLTNLGRINEKLVEILGQKAR